MASSAAAIPCLLIQEALVRYDLADVFTETVLAGNQLAVFAETTMAPDDRRMQAIALEMNLSETVFLRPAEAGGDARVRLFSTVTFPVKSLCSA